jgi:integrase
VTEKRPYGSGSLKVVAGKWRARWYVEIGGQKRQIRAVVGTARKPGTKIGLTKTQAEQRLRKLIAERQHEPEREDEKTLGWAADRMLATLRGPEPQTIDGYRRDLKNHIRPKLGDRPIRGIGHEDVEELVSALEEKGLKPKTIRNVTRLLGQVFNHGRLQRPPWCEINPVEGVELPKVEAPGDVAHFDQPEIPRLLAAVDSGDEFADVDRALYLTAALTGLRQGELMALRWKDIDWTAQRINVRLNRTRKHGDRSPKSKASRRSVPMPEVVGGALDRLSKVAAFTGEDDRVFGHPVSGDVLDYSALDRRFAAAVKRAKVRRITFHGLRHTFAVQCARAGVPMRTLQQWMGHARSSTTEIYARFARDQNEVAIIESAFSAVSQLVTQSEAKSAGVDSSQLAL